MEESAPVSYTHLDVYKRQVKGLLPAEVLGAPVTFMTYTATVMNLGILGLDQTLSLIHI